MEADSFAAPDRGVDELLSLAHERVQVRRIPETLRVDLVDVLRARRPSREPPAHGCDLQAADLRTVAWGFGQLGGDRLTGERLFPDGPGGQGLQSRLLLGGGRGVDGGEDPGGSLPLNTPEG